MGGSDGLESMGMLGQRRDEHRRATPGLVRRVTYVGAVVSNGGDAAIMEAQIATMDAAFPGHAAVLHDSAPRVAASLFPSAGVVPAFLRGLGTAKTGRAGARVAVRRTRLALACGLWRAGARQVAEALLPELQARHVSSIGGADLVAYTGGTSLIEKYDIDAKVADLEIAVLLGKPVVLLPQSVGPFQTPVNRRMIRRVVAKAALVMLRDERSLQHLREIGADTSRVVVVPDVVFALALDDATERLRTRQVPPSSPSVAISVRDCLKFFDGDEQQRLLHQERYERAVAQLVTHLVRARAAHVTFLSTCQGVQEYWTDDSAVAQSIAARLEPEVAASITVDRGHRTARALRDAYGGFDLVVSTRLHGAILALCGGVAVLPIAYEFKTHEVMGQLGLGEYVTDVQTVEGDQLVERFEALVGSLPEQRLSLASNLQRMAEIAKATGAAVSEALGAEKAPDRVDASSEEPLSADAAVERVMTPR